MTKYATILKLLFAVIPCTALAQQDTLITKDNTQIIGELRRMNKGVLTMTTSYIRGEFSVNWSNVKRLSSQKEFIVTGMDGMNYNGSIRSDKDNEIIVYKSETDLVTIPISQVVFLRTLQLDFMSRLSASVSMGYNFTKSNNLSQINLRSTMRYQAKSWTLNGNFNGLSATRDQVEDVQRLDAAVSYRYFFRKNWYPLLETNWLANTEQDLALRTVVRTGMGKYIMRSNKMYWDVQAGTSYNNERFTSGNISSQNSLEGFIASELSLYNVGDLSVLTRVIAYPGITESGRLRLDGVMDVKYNLPLDFFVQSGVTLNYDNRAAQNASDYDYIFQTTFGWQF